MWSQQLVFMVVFKNLDTGGRFKGALVCDQFEEAVTMARKMVTDSKGELDIVSITATGVEVMGIEGK